MTSTLAAHPLIALQLLVQPIVLIGLLLVALVLLLAGLAIIVVEEDRRGRHADPAAQAHLEALRAVSHIDGAAYEAEAAMYAEAERYAAEDNAVEADVIDMDEQLPDDDA